MDYFARHALLANGWHTDVRISVSGEHITAIEADASEDGAQVLPGPVIPAMSNLHSHAFQRAMAGLAEYAVAGKNDFWSWRETMYGLANRVSPGQLEAIATWLYVEMLEAGYSSVAEFHYLHRDAEGATYHDPAEMCRRLDRAAETAGINLTLLPVLYMSADFDGRPTAPEQRRFRLEIDDYLLLLASLDSAEPGAQLGIAFHSLRAVPLQAMKEVLASQGKETAARPIHIHIAEQTREVAACRAIHGTGPIRLLLDNADVNQHWCLVHATHVDDRELLSLAKRTCVVGLCPTTEANLGDGLFPLQAFVNQGGSFGIGSDSHISVSPVEELRWLEYGQRLNTRKRNICNDHEEPHTGMSLWQRARAGGARALGQNIDGIACGQRADLLVLDGEHPLLYGKTDETLLDAFVFAGNDKLLRELMVGGQWRVRDGRHPLREEAARGFKTALCQLAA